MAEESVVPLKPGNAGGGKGPQLETDARSNQRSRPDCYTGKAAVDKHGKPSVIAVGVNWQLARDRPGRVICIGDQT